LGLAGEQTALFQQLLHLAVALLVLLLDGAHHAEQLGDALKALFLGGGGETGVHVGPLVVLAGGGVRQIGQGVGHAVVQQLEPDLGVLLLVARGLGEHGGQLVVAFLLGLGGIVAVLGVSLALPGKGGHQIGFSLGTFQLHGHYLRFYSVN